MKGLLPGDMVFVSACDNRELYILGALKISRVGKRFFSGWGGVKPFAEGRSLAGTFQFLPLGTKKWKLRFENTASTRLAKSKSLLWQVRSRRRLSAESARLLLYVLEQRQRLDSKIRQRFKAETRRLITSVSRIERDPRVRRAVLRRGKYTCSICGLVPSDTFGAWARECLEVHHLKPLAENTRRAPTTMRDVILVCPTCHHALHLFPYGPAAWRRLRSICDRNA